ncbi:MAG: hypothetical protein IRY95_10495, partial [Clostridia bacterium]|nr:hypothetical protein [Clostridia bacterium]
MRWSVREVYHYGVSFVTLMVVLFGAIRLVNGLLAFWEPPFAPDSARLAQIERRLVEERQRSVDARP